MVVPPDIEVLLEKHHQILQIIQLNKLCMEFQACCLAILCPERASLTQEATEAVTKAKQAVQKLLQVYETPPHFINKQDELSYRRTIQKAFKLAKVLHRCTKQSLKDLLQYFNPPKTNWKADWK